MIQAPRAERLPALAASQIETLSALIAEHGGFPVHVFQRGVVKQVAAFQIGEWVGSVAGNPDGPGLLAIDEGGAVIYRGRSLQAAVRAALHFE